MSDSGVRKHTRAELLDFGSTMKGPDYLAINPMGKVPAIRHGNAVVTEAAAICAYLADAFPEAGLAPGGSLNMARNEPFHPGLNADMRSARSRSSRR